MGEVIKVKKVNSMNYFCSVHVRCCVYGSVCWPSSTRAVSCKIEILSYVVIELQVKDVLLR